MRGGAPNDHDDLERAAECARGACDGEAELHFRLRAFSASPSFGALRRLADALSRTQHLEMAAEAWRYVARARPLDAEACAAADSAETRLSQRSSPPAAPAEGPECGTAPHSSNAENGRPSGVYRSHEAPTQEADPKSRKHL
jgi:hypothetical protein